jgi:hypothetical protein
MEGLKYTQVVPEKKARRCGITAATFLTSALDGCGLSALCSVRFDAGK